MGAFTLPAAQSGPVPVIWYLSGLTCDWSNVMEKSGLQRTAAQLGVMTVAPDTSSRGDHVANDEVYDLGQGAGFYLAATKQPWAQHFKMGQYITNELPNVIAANFPADMTRQDARGGEMTLDFRQLVEKSLNDMGERRFLYRDGREFLAEDGTINAVMSLMSRTVGRRV